MPTASDSGWFTWPMCWLFAQAGAAVFSIRLFGRRVAPNVPAMHDARAVADSIGPLALAVPMIAAGFRTDWRIGEAGGAAGWITIGAPVACGALALGIAASVRGQPFTIGHQRSTVTGDNSGRGLSASPWLSPMAAAAWTFAGAVMLLLGAAHDLTIWVGQCAFAAGAVLLWMNTPDITRHAPSTADSQAGGGLSLMLLCAVVQGIGVGFAPEGMLNVAGAMAIAHAAMILALAASLAGPTIAVRMGGWTATLAVLLGLGAISLRHMIPRAYAVIQGEPGRPPVKVASGFGEFAVEATLLLVLGAAALGVERVPSPATRRLIGATLVTGAALLAGWRLAST